MSLIVLRFLIGMLEAPSYPINNRVVTTWFPEIATRPRHRHVYLGAVRRPGISDAGSFPGCLRNSDGTRSFCSAVD